jgi:YD repeat-containing protein
VAVSSGANHTAVLDQDGRVYTWGYGAYGRLGHRDNKDQLSMAGVFIMKKKILALAWVFTRVWPG